MNVEQLMAVLKFMPPDAVVRIEMCDPHYGVQNHPVDKIEAYEDVCCKAVRLCWRGEGG